MIIPNDRILFSGKEEKEGTITVGTQIVNGVPTFYRRLNGKKNPEYGEQWVEEEGYLTYDHGTHTYIGYRAPTSWKKHLVFNWGVTTGFIAFHRAKIVFITISRNACCCLLMTAWKEKSPEKVTKKFYPEPAVAWYTQAGKEVFSVNNYEAWDGWKMCYVYQNPRKRWLQTCNYFMGINFSAAGRFYIPPGVKLQTKEARMLHYLALCEAEQRFPRGAKDQHIMSQLETISYCPNHIDLVIPIEKLSDFIRKEIKIEPVVANVEKHWWFDPEKDVPSYVLEKIDAIYAEDYDIPTLFTGRFWT